MLDAVFQWDGEPGTYFGLAKYVILLTDFTLTPGLSPRSSTNEANGWYPYKGGARGQSHSQFPQILVQL